LDLGALRLSEGRYALWMGEALFPEELAVALDLGWLSKM
jgi:hypothetical protein